jgi:hypothetical protein
MGPSDPGLVGEASHLQAPVLLPQHQSDRLGVVRRGDRNRRVTKPRAGRCASRQDGHVGPLGWVARQLLQLGGASYFDGVGVRLAWWQKADQFFDLVQHATYLPAVTSSSSIAAVWGSTQGVYGAFQPPPRWPTGPTGFKPLRTELGSVVPMNLQGVRIGRVLPGQSEPQVVVSAMGGRVMVLNGSDGTLLTESPDYGLGGMALAVGDLDGNPASDEIVFAPVYSPMPSAGQTVRSYLHVLKGSGTSLVELPASAVPVGDLSTDDFVGYGACGIAIADVAPHGKLVIVGTLNGEVAVFKSLPNGALDPTPVFRTVVEGAVGAFNSIVVASLVPDTEAKPELYIGGSSGLRRFDFQ